MMQEEFMDTAALAQMLNCRREHIYRLVKRGLPHMRLGPGKRAPYRFEKDKVRAWMEKMTMSRTVETRASGSEAPEIYEPQYL